jgi:hypothetical protein
MTGMPSADITFIAHNWSKTQMYMIFLTSGAFTEEMLK